MKHTSLLSIAIAAALSTQAGPQVKWLSTTHNFGAFDEDMGTVSCTFTYTNTGDEPLVVTAAHASCGCTTPRYNPEPLAPGDTATVTVAYNPTGRPGRFSKSVAVVTNTMPPRTHLTVKGVVIGASNSIKSRYPHDIGPLKMRENTVMIGDVTKGHLGRAMAEGYNRGTDSISPVVTGLPCYISVSVIPPKAGPGEQVRFQFFFDSSKCPDYGLVCDSAMITPAPGAQAYPICLTAMVDQDFSRLSDKQRRDAPVMAIAEPTVDFGRISRSGAPVTLEARIANRGSSTMTVHRVYTADRGVTASCDKRRIKPGKDAVVRITVDPSQITGAILNARVTVIADDPANHTSVIRAVGEFLPQ